jgi:hypothetical protein
MRALLIGFVMVLFCGIIFTKKKRAHDVDMNPGLNLGGIEVIHEMEGTKNGGQGIVGSSGTVKDIHRAV